MPLDKSKFKTARNNLKRNWYFSLSVMAYFCLHARMTAGYITGLILLFPLLLVVSSRIPSVVAFVGKAGWGLRLLSALTTMGVCWGGQVAFYSDWSNSPKARLLREILPAWIDVARIVGILGAVAAAAFVYLAVLYFWKTICRIFSELDTFRGLKGWEWLCYAVMFLLVLGFMVFCFTSSEAFYGTKHNYDIIYTSDTPFLLRGEVYISLTHQENDIRQPFFAIFAAPFAGIPYLLGRLPGVTAAMRAMLNNGVQILLLFVSQFMLARMLRLDAMKRVLFILLGYCTYAHMLFSLMMEQYIISCFWLILCVYVVAEKGRAERLPFWGAGGSLLTSAVLLPTMSEKSPFRDFKAWFMDMMKYGLEFALLFLAFCRMDVIFELYSRLVYFSSFSGKTITMMDKVRQYTAFVSGIFAAPDAGANTTFAEHISWQLHEPLAIHVGGVVLLALVVLSAIWNREKRSSRLAAFWVGFSVVMLLGLGWGTQENGLILYALYFGWAFLVLLWQLAEKMGEKLRWQSFAPLCAAAAAIALARINIPAIWEMLQFAITYYPA